MKKILILLAAAVLFIGVNSFADTIALKSGKEIEGRILGRGVDSFEVDLKGVTLAYAVEEIDTINGEEVLVITPQSIQEALSAEEVTAVIQEQPGFQEQPQEAALEIDVEEPQSAAVSESAEAKIDPAKLKEAKRITAIVLLVTMFILLLAYIYSAICLQYIAKKTNASPAWLAWVPVGNIFLMCKIGGVSYWWMLLLLLLFVPYNFITVPVSLGFFGFVWYKIALARNKPGWVGVLAVIPLVHLFIYGYLAFSNHGTASLKLKTPPPPEPTPPPQPTPQ